MRINSLQKYILRVTFACVLTLSFLSCESDLLSDPGTEAPAAPPATVEETADLTGAPTVVSGLTTLAISFTTENASTAKIEYGTASGVYGNSVSGDAEASASHTITLSGLSQGTVYYYRVVAYLDGEAFPSVEYTATTTSEVAPTAAQKARGIWLIGGISGPAITSAVAEVDLYDPVTTTWYPAVTSVPEPVSFAGYAAYDGKLYVIGGFDSTGAPAGTNRDIVQIYDIASNAWSYGAGMPSARAHINAALSYGKIYILGGHTGANASSGYTESLTTFEYDIGGDSWTTKLNYSAAAGLDRFTYASDGVVRYLGGRIGAGTATGDYQNAHDGYIPSINTLTATITETPLANGTTATPRAGIAGALYAPSDSFSAMMLVGGFTQTTGASTGFINSGPTAATFLAMNTQFLAEPFSAAYAAGPPAAGWINAGTQYPGTGTTALGVIYAAAAVAPSVSPARFYVFGGTKALGNSASGQTSCYWTNVPTSSSAWATSWTFVTMPRGRWGHGAVTLDQ